MLFFLLAFSECATNQGQLPSNNMDVSLPLDINNPTHCYRNTFENSLLWHGSGTLPTYSHFHWYRTHQTNHSRAGADCDYSHRIVQTLLVKTTKRAADFLHTWMVIALPASRFVSDKLYAYSVASRVCSGNQNLSPEEPDWIVFMGKELGWVTRPMIISVTYKDFN